MQPRKQRKFLYTAPLHVRRKKLSAHLSKELRNQYKRRALPVRKGDEIKIMRGDNVGKTGKVSRVDSKDYKVYIEGIAQKRTVGTEVQIPFNPSNLQITNLNLDDQKRRDILLRKVKEVKVPEKKIEEKKEEKVQEPEKVEEPKKPGEKIEEKPKEETKETIKEKKEEKSEIKETGGTEVLESPKKGKKVGSSAKPRAAQKV